MSSDILFSVELFVSHDSESCEILSHRTRFGETVSREMRQWLTRREKNSRERQQRDDSNGSCFFNSKANNLLLLLNTPITILR